MKLSREEILKRINKRIELNTHLNELSKLRALKKEKVYPNNDLCRGRGYSNANNITKKDKDYINKKYQTLLWTLYYIEIFLDKNKKV